MSADLEQFKIKISAYSVEQLEEVLISLNKDKFPEKYQLVRETLSNKKGRSPSLPSENLQATVVDSSRAIGLQTPAASPVPVVPVPVAPVGMAAASSPETQAPSSSEEPMQFVPEILKMPEPVKVSEPVPLAAPKVLVSNSAPASPLSSPAHSGLGSGLGAGLEASPKSEASTVSEKTGGALQGFFLLLVLSTSLVAAYCLLLPTMNLPGKDLVLGVARKLPDVNAYLPGLKSNDLQPSENSDEGDEGKDDKKSEGEKTGNAENKSAATQGQGQTPPKPEVPKKN